jgi:hypothetical protein
MREWWSTLVWFCGGWGVRFRNYTQRILRCWIWQSEYCVHNIASCRYYFPGKWKISCLDYEIADTRGYLLAVHVLPCLAVLETDGTLFEHERAILWRWEKEGLIPFLAETNNCLIRILHVRFELRRTICHFVYFPLETFMNLILTTTVTTVTTCFMFPNDHIVLSRGNGLKEE